jgi:hypothetical protein
LPGGGGGSSNWLSICDNVVWKTSDGPMFGYKFYGNPIPLSTEFVDFVIEQKNELTRFNWFVKSEMNNSLYEIEFSRDASKWIPFSSTTSIGDHSQNYTYTHEDMDGCPSGYYKLSVIDLDGNKTELKTIYFKENQANLEIYPNPVQQTEKLMINYISALEENLEIDIIDLFGKVVLSENLLAQKGSNQFSIVFNDLSTGFYTVRVVGENKLIDQKVIVK